MEDKQSIKTLAVLLREQVRAATDKASTVSNALSHSPEKEGGEGPEQSDPPLDAILEGALHGMRSLNNRLDEIQSKLGVALDGGPVYSSASEYGEQEKMTTVAARNDARHGPGKINSEPKGR